MAMSEADVSGDFRFYCDWGWISWTLLLDSETFDLLTGLWLEWLLRPACLCIIAQWFIFPDVIACSGNNPAKKKKYIYIMLCKHHRHSHHIKHGSFGDLIFSLSKNNAWLTFAWESCLKHFDQYVCSYLPMLDWVISLCAWRAWRGGNEVTQAMSCQEENQPIIPIQYKDAFPLQSSACMHNTTDAQICFNITTTKKRIISVPHTLTEAERQLICTNINSIPDWGKVL